MGAAVLGRAVGPVVLTIDLKVGKTEGPCEVEEEGEAEMSVVVFPPLGARDNKDDGVGPEVGAVVLEMGADEGDDEGEDKGADVGGVV